MKSISALIVSLLLSFAHAAARPENAVTRLHVDGMQCFLCPIVVHCVATHIDGVKRAHVSRGSESAVITYDPSKTTPQQLATLLTQRLARWTPPGGRAYRATVAR